MMVSAFSAQVPRAWITILTSQRRISADDDRVKAMENNQTETIPPQKPRASKFARASVSPYPSADVHHWRLLFKVGG